MELVTKCLSKVTLLFQFFSRFYDFEVSVVIAVSSRHRILCPQGILLTPSRGIFWEVYKNSPNSDTGDHQLLRNEAPTRFLHSQPQVIKFSLPMPHWHKYVINLSNLKNRYLGIGCISELRSKTTRSYRICSRLGWCEPRTIPGFCRWNESSHRSRRCQLWRHFWVIIDSWPR